MPSHRQCRGRGWACLRARATRTRSSLAAVSSPLLSFPPKSSLPSTQDASAQLAGPESRSVPAPEVPTFCSASLLSLPMLRLYKHVIRALSTNLLVHTHDKFRFSQLLVPHRMVSCCSQHVQHSRTCALLTELHLEDRIIYRLP